jgi:hypothetical protein
MKAAVRCVFAFAVVSVSMGDLYDQHRLRHRAMGSRDVPLWYSDAKYSTVLRSLGNDRQPDSETMLSSRPWKLEGMGKRGKEEKKNGA